MAPKIYRDLSALAISSVTDLYSSASPFCQAKARKHIASSKTKSAPRQIFNTFLKFVINVHTFAVFSRGETSQHCLPNNVYLFAISYRQ